MNLPPSRRSPDRLPLEIPGPATVLVLSDIHLPYHDAEALELAVAEGRRRKATHVLINGDLLDFYHLSDFDHDPSRLLHLGAELEAGRQFLLELRKAFPRASFIYKEGNHEERLSRYVWNKAPELWGAIDLTLKGILENGFQTGPRIDLLWVLEKRFIILGKLLVAHGHEWRYGFGMPVNTARWLYLRAKRSAFCGHFHQRSEHTEIVAGGKLITTYSGGCLCELSPDYLPYNNWSHGFAIVDLDKDGSYDVSNYKIYKGKVWQ
jgi:predicted phosphodiesterase